MENEAKKPLELYIHIPFCVKKCKKPELSVVK